MTEGGPVSGLGLGGRGGEGGQWGRMEPVSGVQRLAAQGGEGGLSSCGERVGAGSLRRAVTCPGCLSSSVALLRVGGGGAGSG